MATKEQLELALKNAHAAGDTKAAEALAAALQETGAYPSNNRDTAIKQEFENLPAWQKPLQALDDILRIGANKVTLGGVEHLRALAGTQPDVEAARGATDEAKIRAGSAGDATALASGMLPIMMAPQAVVPATAGPVLAPAANLLLSTLEGAGWNGVEAAINDKPVIPAQAEGAVFGAAGHTIAGLLGKGMDMLFNRGGKAVNPFDLRLEKDRAYNAMEDENIGYKPSYVDDLVDRLQKDTKDAWPGVNQGAIGARDRAKKNLRGGGQGFQRTRTMTQVDKERQNIARDASGSPDPRDRPYGHKMKKSIDDWMDEAGAANISAGTGDPQRALDMLHKGRELNQRVEKVDMIDERLGKAKRQSDISLYTGEDSAVKQQLKGILDDPMKRNQYSAAEQEQMQEVLEGTGVGKVARWASKMAPGKGWSYHAGGAAGAAAGLMTGGNVPAMIAASMVPAPIGILAQKVSDSSTKRSVDKLTEMVSTGRDTRGIKGGSKAQRELARLLIAMGVTNDEED